VLELVSGADLTGPGAIRVGAFAARGTAIDLPGPHEVDRLAALTGGTRGLDATAGAIRLATALPFTISEDVIALGDVTLTGGGEVELAGGRRVESGGDLMIEAVNALTLNGSLRATGDIGLTTLGAGAVLSIRGGPVEAGGTLALHAPDGSIGQDAPGAITAARLDARAGLGIQLDAADNSIPIIQRAATTTGDMRLRILGAVEIAGPVSAGDLARVATDANLTTTGATLSAEAAELIAGGTVTLNGVTATIERALLVAAPGGVTMTAAGTVEPRAAALPIVLFDTRTGGFTVIPAAALPDVAGRPAAQQPTQVLRPGGSGQTFGVSSGRAAGNVALLLGAGSSPVFLLIDGANASGDVVAGRLGVHGIGGEANLFGSLGGFPGQAAARFGDVTRVTETGLAPAASLSRYRINECVLSSVNCVNPNVVMVLPPPQVPTVQIVTEVLAREPDAVLPNVGAEEF
jgi:hypothetical protein